MAVHWFCPDSFYPCVTSITKGYKNELGRYRSNWRNIDSGLSVTSYRTSPQTQPPVSVIDKPLYVSLKLLYVGKFLPPCVNETHRNSLERTDAVLQLDCHILLGG
jgi:hypothetical protein